ncbi:hypothetical protein AB6A40_005307 [Gnathostoma spinigerum]|uniref:Cysteine-rich motor neuron 1 protein n=1 Tax=Gnathostoma spinigerum TaxID=75299 RepID=A0ABD6ENN7_9BILA
MISTTSSVRKSTPSNCSPATIRKMSLSGLSLKARFAEPTVVLNPSVCASIEHCPLRCTNGLLRDSQGCFQCICAPHERPSGSQCKQLTEANCDRICAHGYLRDEKGCATCKCAKCPILHQCYKHCLYGFETNNFGCPLCKCRSMSRIDAKLIPMERKGRKGSDTCLSVNSATNKVVERDSGEWWNDGCRHCFCEQKHEFCSLISCPERPESCPLEQWKKEEGSCCPYCALDPSTATSKHEHTVCQSAGRLFVDGETWQLASCTSCTCRVGNVLCRVVECAPIACVNPIYDDSNKCCPICPDQVKHNETIPALPNFANNACVDEAGMVHVHGTAWRIDECTSCRCKESDDGDSHIECYKEKCEKLEDCMGMPLTIKGRCCPICSDMLSSGTMCNYNNNVYSVNEEWRDGPCRNCTCQPGGRTVCNEQQCPPCHDPLLVRGKCCPICRDDGWQSLGENRPHTIFLDNDGGANPTNALLYGLCLFGFIVIALVIFIIIYKLIKKMNDHSEKKSPIHFNNSAVYLSSSKPIGSTPQIFEEFTKRRDSCGDGQSESLLSTTSETSSAISTNSSSGHGPHFDTLPLTAKKVAQRTKSMDYGIRRGFGSFKSSTLGKISQKHGSCNV